MPTPFDDFAEAKTKFMNESPEKQELQKPPTTQDATADAARKKSPRRKKQDIVQPEKGIGPKSPTIYLLKEEKSYLDRLKAFILFSTGEKMTDHGIVMKAVREYVDKYHKDFEKSCQQV